MKRNVLEKKKICRRSLFMRTHFVCVYEDDSHSRTSAPTGDRLALFQFWKLSLSSDYSIHFKFNSIQFNSIQFNSIQFNSFLFNHQNMYTIKISYIKNLAEHNGGLVTPEKAGLIKTGHQIEIHKIKINNNLQKKSPYWTFYKQGKKRRTPLACSSSSKIYIYMYEGKEKRRVNIGYQEHKEVQISLLSFLNLERVELFLISFQYHMDTSLEFKNRRRIYYSRYNSHGKRISVY